LKANEIGRIALNRAHIEWRAQRPGVLTIVFRLKSVGDIEGHHAQSGHGASFTGKIPGLSAS
jgi:hypothetical protein